MSLNPTSPFDPPNPGIQSGSGLVRPEGLTDAEWEQRMADMRTDRPDVAQGADEPHPDPVDEPAPDA